MGELRSAPAPALPGGGGRGGERQQRSPRSGAAGSGQATLARTGDTTGSLAAGPGPGEPGRSGKVLMFAKPERAPHHNLPQQEPRLGGRGEAPTSWSPPGQCHAWRRGRRRGQQRPAAPEKATSRLPNRPRILQGRGQPPAAVSLETATAPRRSRAPPGSTARCRWATKEQDPLSTGTGGRLAAASRPPCHASVPLGSWRLPTTRC